MKNKLFSSKALLSLVLTSLLLSQPFVTTLAASEVTPYNESTSGDTFTNESTVGDTLTQPFSYTEIESISELMAAANEPNIYAVKLTKDMDLTANISINHDFIIYGEDISLNLKTYQMNANSNTLTLAGNLNLYSDSSTRVSSLTGGGKLILDSDSKITIYREVGTSTNSVVEGFKNYLFKTNSIFEGTARTNIVESNKGNNQTAIIRSAEAESFVVEEDAKVTLISASSGAAITHGSTGLSLKKPKGGQLDILVDKGAELTVDAAGTNSRSRDLAPVLILSPVMAGDAGKSSTTIKGTLNIHSNNGNGWYYQYIDYNTITYDSFTVDGGNVNIIADGMEVIRRAAGDTNVTPGEYAAFEHYGPASFDLKVLNGGSMRVKSNGWRAMSLAGGYLAPPKKTISVDGQGSSLYLEGGQFAIAAEGKTDFTINVTDGGYMSTKNTQDSNIYTVGKATYNVIGQGSKLEMIRTGIAPTDPLDKDRSLYGVIFHDAPLVGPLSINVLEGGYMHVENSKGSRAAITTQSHYMTDHKITVDGAESTLKVINNSTANATAGDTSLYPVGAISFAANCSGDIEIKNGGNFYAESYSPNSPTIALGSYGTSKYSGTLTLDHAGDVDIKNNASSATNRAIALRGRNYNPDKNTDDTITLITDTGYLTVYPIGQGPEEWPEALNEWSPVEFSAANKAPIDVTGGKNGDTFMLSDYGRICTDPGGSNYGFKLAVGHTGELKENRKVVLQGGESSGDDSLYQSIIEGGTVSIDIVPQTPELTPDDIKIDNSTELDDYKELIFKKSGTYIVTITLIKDGKTYVFSDILKIAEDEAPIADFLAEEVYYRAGNGETNIIFADFSYSNDGDTIGEVVYKIICDENKDGIYDETPVYVTDAQAFITGRMGNYEVEQTAVETFTDTIPKFLTDSDYKSAVSEKKYFSVLNQAPEIGGKVSRVRELDLVMAYGSITDEQRTELDNRVKQLAESLEEKAVRVRLSGIPIDEFMAEDLTKWDIYEHPDYSDKHMKEPREHSIIINDSSIEMYGYTKQAYKDFLYYNDKYTGEKTFSFDMQRDGADWHSMEGGGFLFNTEIADGNLQGYCMLLTKNGIRVIQIPKMNVDDFRNEEIKSIARLGKPLVLVPIEDQYAKLSIKLVVDGRYITVYVNDAAIINRYLLKEEPVGYGFGPITAHASHGCTQISYFIFDNIKMITKGGLAAFTEAINNYSWNDNAEHVLLYASNESLTAHSTDKQVGIAAESIMNNNIHLAPVSTVMLTSDYGKLLNQVEESSYLDISDIENSISRLQSDILTEVLPEEEISSSMLVTDEMTYSINYSDPENDPKGLEQFHYVKTKNNIKSEFTAEHGLTKWDDTGLYEIYVKVSDNPVSANEYAEWSEEVKLAHLTVHERPMARYTAAAIDNSGTIHLSVEDTSYDPDGRGITASNWKWKLISDTAWSLGLPADFMPEQDYLLSLTVVDADGAQSRQLCKYISTKSERKISLEAEAEFILDTNPMIEVDGSEEGLRLSEDTDVKAFIKSQSNPISSYTLQYRNRTKEQWIFLAEGDGEVLNESIAVLPVSKLADGEYEFILTVTDDDNKVYSLTWLWMVEHNS